MNRDHIKLAIAPIGWTNDDMPELGSENSFQQCISEMALAGFVGCEVGNKYPRDIAQLKKALDLRGLQICNAWHSTFFAKGHHQKTLDEFTQQVDFLHSLGAKVIGCSEQSLSIQGTTKAVYEEKPEFSDIEWARVTDGYNQLAEIAATKGISVTLHHHMGTGIQTPAEIDRFMSATNDNVGLLFDTGHIYCSERSQQSVMAVLEKHIARIRHVHLKDCRDSKLQRVKEEKLSFLDGVRLGMFTAPGDGVIDFKPVFELLDRSDYQGWMVVEAEQDPAIANPLEYALKARQYLRDTAGI